MKMAESSLQGKKTFCEKEKLLITCNFSFSYSIFKTLQMRTHKNQGLFGKGMTLMGYFFDTPQIFLEHQ